MSGLKVLLVDDEEEFVSALAERLRLRGFDVETAGRGEDALRVMETRLPDVVVMDLMMPGLGGMETLRRIKAKHSGLGVILLTGHGGAKEGEEGVRSGAFDYLMKPLNIGELIDKIREAARG